MAADAPAEQWSRTFGGADDEGLITAAALPDGGYLLIGYARPFPTAAYDGWLVKVSATGEVQLNKTYGGDKSDWFEYLVPCSDGGYVLAGYTNSWGAGMDGWLVKVSATGEQQWSHNYGGTGWDGFERLIACSDGSYLLVGGIYGNGPDGWLVKVSATGEQQWSKTYGGSGYDWFRSVVSCSDGGYLIAGHTSSQGVGGTDGWLVKVSATGEQQWSHTYGGMGEDILKAVMACPDGGYLLAGYTNSTGAGSMDGWLVKVSANGEQQWSNTYGENKYDTFEHVVLCSDGGYLMAGNTNSTGAGDYDGWVVKASNTGSQQWSHTYGGTALDWCWYLASGSDGGYLLSGYTESYGAGETDGWAVKLAPEPVITTTTSTPALGLGVALLCLVFVSLMAARRR